MPLLGRLNADAQFILQNDMQLDGRNGLPKRRPWASSRYWSARRLQPKAYSASARHVCTRQALSLLDGMHRMDMRCARGPMADGDVASAPRAPSTPKLPAIVPQWAHELRRSAERAVVQKAAADKRMERAVARKQQQKDRELRTRQEARRIATILDSADLHGSLLKQVNSLCEVRAQQRTLQKKLDREKNDRQRVAELHERSLRAVCADDGRQLAAQAISSASAVTPAGVDDKTAKPKAELMHMEVDVMGSRQIFMQQRRPELMQ